MDLKERRLPRTLNELFLQSIERRGGGVVYSWRKNREWQEMTAPEVRERVRRLALGLHGLGVKAGDRVALLSESRPEWSLADYAILATGAVNVPIYPTQAVDQVGFILSNSGARLLFVSGERQLQRIAPALAAMTEEERPRVILFDKGGASESLEELEARGEEIGLEEPGLFERLAERAGPEDLATIIYTSGTTGVPKGVMLTHHNLVSNTIEAGDIFQLEENDVGLSFLPLSHVFERTVLYIYMWRGVRICFARGVETVAEDIRQVRPTIVTAVPRLFERIYATINKRVADATPLQQRIFHRAIRVGRKVAVLRDGRRRVPVLLAIEHRLLDRLVFSKWREAVGGRIRFFVSGGAALPSELAYIFLGAGITILQGYGLTETSPVVSFNRPGANRVGTIGQTIPGVTVRVAPDGELLVRGDNVMRGYYEMPQETAEVLESLDDGVWFHTGDIGTVDDDAYIRITDRKKDLIKTSLGKYIAPQPIENLIRGIPMVEQAVVIGNGRKFAAALIVPSFEGLRAYARSIEIESDDVSVLAKHPRIIEYFRKKIDAATRDLAPHEKIKKIALIDQEFSVETGELTPTLKVRRRFVEEKNRELIDSLYPKTDID